jgi:F-box domain.
MEEYSSISTSLSEFPEEIIYKIMNELDLEDLSRFRRTSKLFDRIANDFNKKILLEYGIFLHPYLYYAYSNKEEFISFCELQATNIFPYIEFPKITRETRQIKEIFTELELATLFVFAKTYDESRFLFLISTDFFSYEELIRFIVYIFACKFGYVTVTEKQFIERELTISPMIFLSLSYEGKKRILKEKLKTKEEAINFFEKLLKKEDECSLFSFFGCEFEKLLNGIITTDISHLLDKETLGKFLYWYGYREMEDEKITKEKVLLCQEELFSTLRNFFGVGIRDCYVFKFPSFKV